MDESQQTAAEPDQDPGHVARLWPAAEACRHQRHPVVVYYRPGRQERAGPWSYPRQPLTLSAHVAALCRSGYYQLRQLRPLVQSMTVMEAARTAAAAFISCRLDYCNSLLYGLPDTLLRKLQSVQNATARLITGTRCSDHISPVLRKLHWLPIREYVRFKVACLVRQSLSGQAPLYLADDCRLVSDSTRRSLRSADISTCVVPPTLSSYGYRTFAAAGPRLWNSLPVQLRNPDITYGLFRRTEGPPFSGSTNTTLCDFWYAAP